MKRFLILLAVLLAPLTAQATQRFQSGVTDQYLYFVAVDPTDKTTRETGLTGFTVARTRNGSTAVAMTTPTVIESHATLMPGVYGLLLDEDMTIGTGNSTESLVFHITQGSMEPVSIAAELFDLASQDDIAQSVRDQALAGAAAGSLGEAVSDIETDVAAILLDTGTNGVALSAAALASLNVEVDTALGDIGLPKLVSEAASDTDVADNSLWARLTDDGVTADYSNYSNVVHSLKQIGDAYGAISDLGSGATIGANLLDIQQQTGIGGANLTAIPYNTNWNVSIEQQALDALNSLGMQYWWNTAISAQPTAGSWAADLTEDNAGTQRFTTAALANAPSGGGGGGAGDNQTKIWYVDTNVVGGDDDGTTAANAFDTIAEATAVAGMGDTILVANGTYTLTSTVTMPAGTTMIGEDYLQTHLTKATAGECVQMAGGCTIRNMRITHTGDPVSNSWAVDCSLTAQCTLENVYLVAGLDGLYAASSTNLRLDRCYIEASYDAIACGAALNLTAVDTKFVSTADYDTGDATIHAVYCPNATNLDEDSQNYYFRNCSFEITRTAAKSFDTVAVSMPGTSATFENCAFLAQATNAGNTGGVYALKDTATHESHFTLIGGYAEVTNAGSGVDYDISLEDAASTARCVGFAYDVAEVQGDAEQAAEAAIAAKLPSGASLIAGAGSTNTDLDDISSTNTAIPVLQHDIARPFVFRMSRRSDGQLKAINKIRLSNIAERPRIGFEMSPWMQAKPSGVTFAVLDSNGDATTDLVVSSDASDAGARDYLVMTKITNVVAAGTYTVRATVTGADTSVVVAEGSVVVP